MLDALLALLVPPRCAICAEPCAPGDDACGRCIAELAANGGCPLTVPGVDRAWAATAYDGAARRLVAQLKFGRRIRLARLAARTIAGRIPAGELRGAVVPVPADPLRRRLRGFDPAALIAAELARTAGLPLSHCLVRRHGRRQVGRPRAERLASPPELRLIEPAAAEAVLVDDVTTTGTTLAACAAALRAGGCENLLAVAFARA